MRKLICHECGKPYDFDVDDFCPRCGAFTPPSRTSRIDENGAVVRVDGINEQNHEGSFAHRELHAENRKRRNTPLSKGVRRVGRGALSLGQEATLRRPKASAGQRKKITPLHIVAAIIVLNVLFNLLGGLLAIIF